MPSSQPSSSSSSSGISSGGSSFKKSKMKNAIGAPSDQAVRLRSIEESVCAVLRFLSQGGDRADVPGRGDGAEGRLDSIEKMMAELKEVVQITKQDESKKPSMVPTEKDDRPLAQKRSNEEIGRYIEKRRRYRPMSELELQEEVYNKYFLMKFDHETRRSINPYAIIAKIEATTGGKPKSVTAYNSTSVTVEVHSKEQAQKMHEVTTVDGFPCETMVHPRYNHSKGLIYTYEFDVENLEDFKAGLNERYNITDVQQATFIKTKSEQAHAFIVYFNQRDLPYSIYIPGEKQDTRVFQFRNKPLICHKCQGYGHNSKWCRSKEDICRRCSAAGHDITKCTAETPVCYYCKEAHQTGSKECVRQLKEQVLVEIQEKERVTIRRARQILEGECEHSVKPAKRFPTHYNCTMAEGSKKKFTPWLLEKSISKCLGSNPRTIRTLNNTTFVVEVASREQAVALSKLTEVNGIEVKVEENSNLSVNKGIIYINEYNMRDFNMFKEGLKQDYGLLDVIEATRMNKGRNGRTVPLLIDFRGDLPAFLEVPGEQARTKVVEYKRSPLMCRKCQEFGHSQKWCVNSARCGRCSEEGHETGDCEAREVKCYHCEKDHIAGSRTCLEYKYQEEILAVQVRERVTRNQARIIFDRRNPTFRSMNFSEAVKQVGENIQKEGLPKADPKGEEARQQVKDKKEDRRTEVVCMSPGSGQLFTTRVHLGNETPSSSNWDDEDTSETSTDVREEVRAIFHKERERQVMEESDNDREQYEKELKKATIQQGKKMAVDKGKSRERSLIRNKDTDRRRSKSPQSRRAHSDPNDQTRGRHSSKRARHR